MEDGNLVDLNDTSPIEQSQRNSLFHRSRPEEVATFLIELPQVQVDAPRPSSQTSSRSRRSSIINAQHLPDTAGIEEDPLQEYVRRNLASFRKSIVPEDVQDFTRDRQSVDGEEVSPTTATERERDVMDNGKRNSERSGGQGGYSQRENRDEYTHAQQKQNPSEEKTLKHRESSLAEQPFAPKVKKHKDSRKREDSTNSKAEKIKREHRKHGDDKKEQPLIRNEVIVMPALETVSTEQRSPFTKERREPKKEPSKPVKIELSVESLQEEVSNDRKNRNKDHSKREKGDHEHGGKSKDGDRRRRSRETSKYLWEEDNTLPKKRHKKRESLRKSDDSSMNPKENGEESKVEPEKKHPRKHRSSGEGPISRYDSESPRRSDEKNRYPDDHVDYSRTKQPFGGKENYAVHYVATDGGKKKAGGDSKKKQERAGEMESDMQKYMTEKAPRSAKKVMLRRRYHIQIPEHRAETWFNVRFNMNNDNVDMNYEGPVKINNYYVSNNYS